MFTPQLLVLSHYLYIIFSKKLQKFYVGETQNIENRISQHNNLTFKKSYTKASNDWILKLKRDCKNRDEALFLEKFIKRMKSKIFIQKIINNPEILDDIILKL